MSQLLPAPVSFAYPPESTTPTDQVYFSEVTPSLLRGVPGLGSFDIDQLLSNATMHTGTQVSDKSDTAVTTPNDGLIRYVSRNY